MAASDIVPMRWLDAALAERPLQRQLDDLLRRYIVNRVDETVTRYIESGPEYPDGTGRNIPVEKGELDPSYADLANTKFGWPLRVNPGVFSGMTQAVGNWRDANIQYNPLGPNSNNFVSWILRECEVRAAPPPFSRPYGW